MPRVSSLVVWLTSDGEKGLSGGWRNKTSTTAWYGFPVSVLGPIVPHRSTRQAVSRTPPIPKHDPVRLFAQGAPGLSHPVCNERNWTPRECPAFGTSGSAWHASSGRAKNGITRNRTWVLSAL